MILILYYTLHFIEVKFISNIMVCLQNRLLFGKIGTVNICSYVGCGSRILVFIGYVGLTHLCGM